MAEPTPGRPGGTGESGPRSATAATFQVNDKSLRDLHTTWRNLVKDVKDFNTELQNLSRGAKTVDQIVAKLGQLGIGSKGGSPVGGQPPLAGGAVPDNVAKRGRGGGRPSADSDDPDRPPLAGGASPWRRRGEVAGKIATAAAAGAGLFYAKRMDDISDLDLFFNQQAQNTGYGYRNADKSAARNAFFGSPGGNGFGSGVTGYQSAQDFLGGARAVFGATGGTFNGRGMAQLRQAGQLASLTPDMGLAGAGAAVGSLYDPTTSARLNSIGAGPSVGMRGQLQSPQAIYQRVLQAVYRGTKPTARMITEGLQPGAPLYVTLTQGLGLTPDAIEQFARYAIAQANLTNPADINRALNAASRGQAGSRLSAADKALVNQAGLNSSIRSRQNEAGAADTRRTVEAGREGEGALMKGFSALADITDTLTDTFKRLNDISLGASGNILGTLGVAGGGLQSALNTVGGVGGGMFAMQALRQARGAPGTGGPGGFGGMLGRGAMGIGGRALLGGAAAGLGGFAAGELADWGLRKAGVKNKWGQAAGGALAGAATGAAIGSIIPGAGTVVGGVVGGLAGGIAGYFAEGGEVPGYHDRDDVTIRATPGELVVPRHVVKRHGGAMSLMERLGFRGAGADGHYADGGEVTGDTKGLNPDFLKRLKAWSAFVGQPFNVGSGYRSIDEQKVLYDRWMRHVPGQAKAAKPGSSNHNYGLAADGPRWGDKHPEKFGLRYPMSFEPWHVEPLNAKAMRGGAGISAGVDDTASDGVPPEMPSPGGVSRNLAHAPGVFADEKSIFAAFLANANDMSGVSQPPAGDKPAPTAGGSDATQPQATASGAPENAGGNIALGKQKAAARGWTGTEWDALYNLFEKESGWRTDAANASSSARGIAQTMMSVHFGKNWKTDKRALAFLRNPGQQIDWGMNYIAQRYTTPSKAWAHSQKFNWYDTGAWQTENETAVLHKDEMVVPAAHARKLRSLVRDQQNNAAMAQPQSPTQRERGTVKVDIHMPVQLVGQATQQDAKHLVQMVKHEMEQDEELAMMGSG